jgi:UDPglucose 6-dehydrogenase
LAQDAAVAALGDKVVESSSMEQAVRDCDLLIVATGWPEYKTIDPAWCKRSNGTRLTVLDLWRTLPADKFSDVADVLYLGSGR